MNFPLRLLLVVFGCLSLAGVTSAEVYKCIFTEPFFSVTFDSESGQLTVLHEAETTTDEVTGERIEMHRISKASIRKTGENTWEIANEKRTVVLTLTLDEKGSDGMSETIYPYSAICGKYDGGAYSNTRPAKRVTE